MAPLPQPVGQCFPRLCEDSNGAGFELSEPLTGHELPRIYRRAGFVFEVIVRDKIPEPISKFTSHHASSELAELKAGDLIGYADNTGFSAGDHLHFGLKPMALNENEQGNGYGGTVDHGWPEVNRKKDVLIESKSEPCAGRLEKNGLLRAFITPTGILVVRFSPKKCPFGAESRHL